MIKIPPDFREFIELLNAHEVAYLLMGGYAVAAHGHVRATGDIDFWVAPTPVSDAIIERSFFSYPLI